MATANKHRAWVEISKSAVEHNLQTFRKILPPDMAIMAVVKSNAYGHGLEQMVNLLKGQVEHFSVVFIEEALALRALGVEQPILVFSTVIFDEGLIIEAIRQSISFTIYDQESYQRISQAAEKIQQPALIHINLDTGMSRLGFADDSCPIEAAYQNKFLQVEGLYSHLSSADSDPAYTREQCEKFKKVLAEAESGDRDILYEHILNTPATMLGINIGNVARLGLGLYGLPPSKVALKEAKKIMPDFSLKPVLGFKTRIIQVRRVATGTSVGYGRAYKTDHPIVEAIIPIGFSDGYDRELSNCGEMLVRGKRCPVLGRICMNNTMIDVSEANGVSVGDEVVIIGQSGAEQVTAPEIAEKLDTVSAEAVTVIPKNIPRVYID